MHQTNHERMEAILSYKRPSTRRPVLLHSAIQPKRLVSLPRGERIRNGDIIEDIETGTRERVSKNGFYGFLRGISVEQAKQLPAVFDVLRAT